MIKKGTFMIVAASVIVALFYVLDIQTLPIWKTHHFDNPENLAEYIRSFGAMTIVISLSLMVLQTLFTPLPLFLLAGANGFIFGVWYGILITLVGSILGATIAFYVARGFGRGMLSRYMKKAYMTKVDEMSCQEGPWMVFMARLIPVIPSSIISYLAGLSKMTFRGFFVATAIGKIPEIVIYTVLGHSFTLSEGLATKVTTLLILITILAWPLISRKIKKNKQCNSNFNFDDKKPPHKIPPD